MKKPARALKVSTVALVKAYGVQSGRMKELVRKGRACEERMVILAAALAVLLEDKDFVELLDAENSLRMPKIFQDWIAAVKGQEA